MVDYVRNVEAIEHELVQLKSKTVIVTVPIFGKVNLSLAGELEVVQTKEFACAFHISSPMGWSIVFTAEDVLSIKPITNQEFAKVINLGKSQ